MGRQRIEQAVRAGALPLARKSLQVAYTIGEASNFSVLKGLSAVALLVLDTCEVRFR